jgi:branched-subunit amino acid transport protein AzlD
MVNNMVTGISKALLLTIIMAVVIFFCRACVFLFLKNQKLQDKKNKVPLDTYPKAAGKFNITAFINYIEKIVPPVAMTVLAFNALTGTIHESIIQQIPVYGIPAAAAAVFTVFIHLWRRNPLISIFGGTALFMVLEQIISR